MKKRCCAVLVLLCCCLALAGLADGLQEIHCSEQGFSTRIPEGASAEYVQEDGMTVYAQHKGYIPFVLIWRRDTPFKNPVNYLNNVFREHMENSYGPEVGTNPAKTMEIGGKQLLGARYHYKIQQTGVCLLRLIEQRADGDVEFTAKYVEGDDQAVLEVLDAVVRYYQPDNSKDSNPAPEKPAPEKSVEGLTRVEAVEQGFSTTVPEGMSAEWIKGDGLTISAGKKGQIPFVLVFRRESKLKNPEDYLNRVYKEHMDKTYGNAMLGTLYARKWDIGGKMLLGARYYYRVEGKRVCLFRLVEIRDDGDVEYTAKFVEGDETAVLMALEAAVGGYQVSGK